MKRYTLREQALIDKFKENGGKLFFLHANRGGIYTDKHTAATLARLMKMGVVIRGEGGGSLRFSWYKYRLKYYKPESEG